MASYIYPSQGNDLIDTSGAGKTTPYLKIGGCLALPYLSIDRAVRWLPGWHVRDRKEQRQIIRELVDTDCLIMCAYTRSVWCKKKRALVYWTKSVLTLFLTVFLWLTDGVAAENDYFLPGLYASPGLSAVYKLENCKKIGNSICGSLIWTWETDDYYAFPVGSVIITGLRPEDGFWKGQIRDPVTGRNCYGKIKKSGENAILVISGAGPSCSTERWISVKAILSSLSILTSKHQDVLQ